MTAFGSHIAFPVLAAVANVAKMWTACAGNCDKAFTPIRNALINNPLMGG